MKLFAQLRRSFPILLLAVVLGYAALYAVAWVQLYRQPHPYRVASEWIFANIPQGSVLVGPHWDDRLPLSIPGKDAPRYYTMEGSQSELPFYERDTREKLSIVLRRMAKADYIVFPTARISDSIPRVPDEYPYTSALLQLLWAEKLGFSFEKSVKDRPSFLGVTFNDDLADESFSVYDHPKVVIFKNQERLSEDQMRERILNADRYEPLPTLNEILLMDEGGWAKTATVHNPNPLRLAKTFALLILLGVSSWILFARWLSFLPDRGLGMSFLGGVALSGTLTFVSAALGVLPFNRVSGTFFVLLVVLAALIRFFTSREVRRLCVDVVLHHGANVLLSLFVGVAVVVTTKSLYPNYFWGVGELESFALSFFSRNETIPPSSNWNPNPESSIMYGGYLLAGWLVQLVGASGSFAYELCFVMIGGAVGGIIYSIVSAFFRRPNQALLITLLSIIPVIRGVHVVFNGYSGLEVAQAQASLSPNQERLAKWLSENVQGAPLVVEACDQPGALTIATKVGLPTLKGEGGQVICSLADPESAFKAMTSNSVALLIVSGQGEGQPPARTELLAKFAAHPEFFAPVYSDGGSLVLAPASSRYYPRAYNKKIE